MLSVHTHTHTHTHTRAHTHAQSPKAYKKPQEVVDIAPDLGCRDCTKGVHYVRGHPVVHLKLSVLGWPKSSFELFLNILRKPKRTSGPTQYISYTSIKLFLQMDFQKVSGSTNQEEERLKKWEVVKIPAKMISQRT